MIVLDTSAVIDFTRGGERIKHIVESAENAGDTITTTAVSFFELLTPVYHRRFRREEGVLKAFMTQTVLLGLDQSSAEEASKIMGSLLRLGRPINPLDALICGIAVSNKADSIVTSDKDFLEAGKIADIAIQLI